MFSNPFVTQTEGSYESDSDDEGTQQEASVGSPERRDRGDDATKTPRLSVPRPTPDVVRKRRAQLDEERRAKDHALAVQRRKAVQDTAVGFRQAEKVQAGRAAVGIDTLRDAARSLAGTAHVTYAKTNPEEIAGMKIAAECANPENDFDGFLDAMRELTDSTHAERVWTMFAAIQWVWVGIEPGSQKAEQWHRELAMYVDAVAAIGTFAGQNEEDRAEDAVAVRAALRDVTNSGGEVVALSALHDLMKAMEFSDRGAQVGGVPETQVITCIKAAVDYIVEARAYTSPSKKRPPVRGDASIQVKRRREGK